MAKQEQGAPPNQINMIGAGTVVDGTLRAEGDVRVSGRVLGTLQVDGRIIVAQEGIIEGEVTAANADVAGRVQGDLNIDERLVLRNSARVEGTIQTGRFIVEEGAQFDGECTMNTRTVTSKEIDPVPVGPPEAEEDE
jgi:cytoskeletal protein CcmA (bactofilin family)